MSNSREWSQRHIEELIKRNDNNINFSNNVNGTFITIYGPPSICSFSALKLTGAGFSGINYTDKYLPHYSVTIVGINGDFAKTVNKNLIPILPICPIKISSSNVEDYNITSFDFQTYFFERYKFKYGSGNYRDENPSEFFKPYIKHNLCLLTSDDGTYIGYGDGSIKRGTVNPTQSLTTVKTFNKIIQLSHGSKPDLYLSLKTNRGGNNYNELINTETISNFNYKFDNVYPTNNTSSGFEEIYMIRDSAYANGFIKYIDNLSEYVDDYYVMSNQTARLANMSVINAFNNSNIRGALNRYQMIFHDSNNYYDLN